MPTLYQQSVLDRNPVCYFPLDDPIGSSVAADIVNGGSFGANRLGNSTLGNAGHPGNGGTTCAYMPGIDNPDSGFDLSARNGGYYGLLALQPPFTIECWIRGLHGHPGADDGDGGTFLFRWRFFGYGPRIIDFGGQLGGYASGGAIPISPSGTSYWDNTWHLVTWIYASPVRIYVDGVQVVSGGGVGSQSYSSGGGIAIGRDGIVGGSFADYYTGYMSDFAIFPSDSPPPAFSAGGWTIGAIAMS